MVGGEGAYCVSCLLRCQIAVYNPDCVHTQPLSGMGMSPLVTPPLTFPWKCPDEVSTRRGTLSPYTDANGLELLGEGTHGGYPAC